MSGGLGDKFMEFMRDPVAWKRKRDDAELEDQPGRALQRSSGNRRKATGYMNFEEIERRRQESQAILKSQKESGGTRG